MSYYYEQQQQHNPEPNICDGPTTFGEQDDDEQSIIDVFEFDDSAQDRWLFSVATGSRRNSVETKIQDLDAWLHEDLVESENAHTDNSLRKFIDSRTFTRIKRQSKLNFESAEPSVSPETMIFSQSNIWKNQTIAESPSEEQNVQKSRKDNVPMMLRPKTNQVLAALLSESPSSISSQTSMEAFMNITRSKEGLNSLLSDMSESDVNHFLMNVSQPSLLYSSIISDGKGDESLHMAGNDSFVDSQILTDSMMEASMFKEVQDTTMLAEFLKQSNDSTILEDKTICTSLNKSDINNETYSNVTSNINATFTNLPLSVNENELNSTNVISFQENLLNSSEVDINTCSSLDFTKTISLDHDTTVLLQSNDDKSKTGLLNKESKTGLMYESKSELTLKEEKLNDTFHKLNFSIPKISGESTDNSRLTLDATFNAVPSLRVALLQEVQRSTVNKFDTTFNSGESPSIENNLDATYDCSNIPEAVNETELLDATYIQVASPHKLEFKNESKGSNTTYDSSKANTKLSNMIGLRKISESQMQLSEQNRFNTFKKEPKIGSRLSKELEENHLNKTAPPLQSHALVAKNNDNLYQQRFNTFSKKMSTVKNKICIENNVNEIKPENKFIKPPDKICRKIQAPRQLSKLPQLFQKSNPNLGATLKSTEKLTVESDVEFNKRSQPNICGNMYSLGRFKSERILQIKNKVEYSKGNSTSRSMESIESTASAYSAPDIEDRLSMCSESSRASYTIKPKDFETLYKISSTEEQDEKFCGISIPKLKGHQILENIWVQEKDLPSPILKNNIKGNYIDSGDSTSTSPTDSAEFNAKTSSPLTVSPISSDQALNIIGLKDGAVEAIKDNIQTTINTKPSQIKAPSVIFTMASTTKLRRPTNWTGAPNKIGGNAVSGIPRPASRIPAPKITRPNLK